MIIQYLQHVPFEGLGIIENWAINSGHKVFSTPLYKNQALPKLKDFDWLFIMGGPMSVNDSNKYPWIINEINFIKEAINYNKTVIGICLGAQIIARALGKSVYKNKTKEIGWYPVKKAEFISPISKICPKYFEAFHWHGETFDLPKDAIRLYSSEACLNQAFLYKNNVLALQFHLEFTKQSLKKIIKNCREEITDSENIMSEAKMLDSSYKLGQANKIMENILNFLYNN